MELSAAWGPCEFQLAKWSFEEPVAAGLPVPVEYTSIDIFGACCSPQAAYVPESSGGQQLVQFHSYYSAASTSLDTSSSTEVVGVQNGDEGEDSRVSCALKQVEDAYKADVEMMEEKMHRYPASLRGLNESYTVPRYVAMGPYHHHRAHLKKAETVKHAAAIRCVTESGHRLQEIYDALVPVADHARRLYDKDVMVGIGYDDFRHMMFFDACFLVQFMVMDDDDHEIDPSLLGSLNPNQDDIFHDVMLLENQLPWQVVETIMRFRPVPWLPMFILNVKNCLQDHKPSVEQLLAQFAWNEDYKPPHFLGLVRYYIVGRSDDARTPKPAPTPEPKKRSVSASAMELAEIGITLKAKKMTNDLIHMGLEEGILLAELSLASLCLDRDRASYLINMAALELCTVEKFTDAPDEDSAVCSYLMLLAMLVYKEEDVHELRARGILEGGGGLSNKEALRFFTGLQGVRLGPCYIRVMEQIGRYKDKRQVQTKLHAYYQKKKKIIYTASSAIIAVITILGTLVGILVKIKSLKAA